VALSVLIALPLAGAVGVLVLRQQGRFESARRLALGVGAWTLAATLAMWASWDGSVPGVQLVERMPWVAALGVSYHVGVDGVGLAFVTLIAWLTVLALSAALRMGRHAPAGLPAAMLLLESAAITAVAARDLLLFFVGTEVAILATFAIIGGWGRDRRVHAATKFLLCQLTGSSLMLVAIVWMAWRHQIATGVWSYAIDDLAAIDLPVGVQGWLWGALAFAFVIRIPVFPLHTWLSDALAQAPAPGAVLIGGVVVPVGGYGLLRVAVPLLPEATAVLTFWLAIAAAAAVVYGAVSTFVQTDLRRVAAALTIGHLGVVVLGVCSGEPGGRAGALIQLLSVGGWTGTWLLVVGMLVARRQTTQIAEFGGLLRVMPGLSVMLGLVAAAAVALPGTIGSVGFSLVLQAVGASEVLARGAVWASVAVVGGVLWTLGMLRVIHRVLGGPVTHDRNRGLRDLTPGEWISLAPLVAALITFGLWPEPLLALVR
jgi:NADH-quinone oxidoreductase subunit M